MATKGIYNCQSQYTMATPLGSPDPFLAPECCQKWQMGLLWGKESQPLLWQCLKTLVGSIGNTRMATKGIYNCQSQYTMATPLGSSDPFLAPECCQKWQMGLLWGKESQQLLWQCLKTLVGSIGNTRMATKGIYNCQSQYIMATPLGSSDPFLTPECCQKWQMGLLWGKESQQLLWQCLKTLVGSIGNTRMATKGIYNCQSQYTMATPLGSPDPFLAPECCQKWQMGLLWGKESQPLLWQCLKTLVGSIGNTRMATKGIYNCQSQYTMATPLGSPDPFLAPECCQKWQMGLLWGKESQPLLWQCLKTLVGSIGNTRMATKGIYNCQSQYTMATPLGSSDPFLAPECCQKWQMGLLWGKESQQLLWQCLKTLVGSIGNTRMATKGIYNCQSQYIMATPLGSSDPFLTPECCQKWQMGLLWGKESQQLLWQCLKTLVGSIGNTRMATKDIYNCQSQYTMATPLGSPDPFLAPECCQKWQMGLLWGKESQQLLWWCFETLVGSIGNTRMATKGIYNCQSQYTMATPLGSSDPFLTPECCQKRQMGLLWGEESQPLLWQCLKTLVWSIGNTRMATKGIYNCQSQYTMATPLGSSAPFLAPECCQKWQMGLLWGEESQPLLW